MMMMTAVTVCSQSGICDQYFVVKYGLGMSHFLLCILSLNWCVCVCVCVFMTV